MNLVELNSIVLASGPNVVGLKTFFQGDGIYLISVIVAIYVIKSFKDANWLKIGSVLAMYAIVVSLLKGQQILSFLGGLLRWFGIETGL
ncbi:TPA: hypothetical protein U3J84_001791 [Streptococcus agalactiae]|uniref:Hypothetical membrane spanning protein n=1 Tax=Streptococcus agalactiae TaxID=1311 RepID=A0AB74H2E4_STRAG|nr:hypothetical protein [Streptococcus agalactiae]EPV86453.1 hypothetical protein SAG0014_04335 [Streptococcus agalactiae FSL S3-586]KLL27995.1 hypothetical protein WA01_07560 [Streptococcus agalactiae]MDK6300012.1 hypothetical protein [Streptococcus agalactiae]PWT25129.1 hypothetical protein CUZ34_02525 [Streptococcus agalactiae]QHO94267.1 hypothetical protein C2E46_10885 [Streptococcus agalactiae]